MVMHKKGLFRRGLRLLAALSAVLLVGLLSFSHAPRMAAAPQEETPITVVYSGVTDYSLAPPAVYWHESPPCNGDPGQKERISVLPLAGGLSRSVYAKTQACATSAVLSNVAMDEKYLYWISPTGLVRMPRSAGDSDQPQLVNALVGGPGELVDAGDRLYTLSRTGGNSEIAYVLKSNSQRVPVTTISGDAYVLSFDGDYLYYLIGSTLIRLEPNGKARELGSGITSYHADGRRTSCVGGSCLNTHLVFIAQGKQVVRFDNLTDSTLPSYTSPEATAVILGITTDGEKLFLYERRTTVCDPLCTYSHNLVRAARNGVPEATDGPFYSSGDLLARLATADGFVYWREYPTPTTGVLKRLGTKAGPITLNLKVNNILVTQGIQHLNNNVPLIKDRRTFVRVFAQSNGATAQGVTAFLYGSWNGGNEVGPLLPANPAGTKLNVANNYLQEDINQAFLFELPWDWTEKNGLRLRVELNPYRIPLETNTADNSFTVGPFDFKPSGRLEVQFVSFGFMLNNQTYYPSLLNDVLGNYSWIRRVYPVASAPGFITDPSPGFRPNNWFVFDAGLGTRVNRTAAECSLPPYIIRDAQGNIVKNYGNLCASGYTNARMTELRQANQLDQNLFMYGMIRDLGGDLFPRGQAWDNRVSSGPAAPGFVNTVLYAQHEIGHTLGRGHPLAGNGQCGLKGSDPSPAYPNAKIGPQSGTVEGFDGGDPARGEPWRVMPAQNYTDLMAYCGPQWISDQNYKNLFAAIPAAALLNSAQTAARTAGPTLFVSGIIDPASDSAAILLASTGNAPAEAPRPSAYRLRLFGANGNILAELALPVATAEHSPGWLAFDHTIPFPQGVRRVEVQRAADGAVLATLPVSAGAPMIDSVTVTPAGASTLVLAWTASDTDGSPLHFDIHYSHDSGAHFQPLQLGLAGNKAQIDTAELGGGEGIFRVYARDGVHTALADSAIVPMPAKPPVARILTPAAGAQFLFGQTINLSGEARDPQDVPLADAELLWRVDGTIAGAGPLLTLSPLPPGDHTIQLAAKNGAGQTGTAEVEITVADDLGALAPFLSAAPASAALQVEAGATITPTAVIALTNVGAGEVQWTAQSNKTWLVASPASGAAGQSLTLKAAPAGLGAGQVYEALVTISAQDGEGQALPPQQLPVQLIVGNLREGSPPGSGPGAGPLVFLPFVRR